MTTLALEVLAQKAPTVSFVHDFPGGVMTDLFKGAPGIQGFMIFLAGFVMKHLFARWVCVPIEECGERHVFLATSGKYKPKEGKAVGIPLLDGENIAKGADGEYGSGVYSVDWDGEGPGQAEAKLKELRRKELREVVWNHLDQKFNGVKGPTEIPR